MSTPLVPSPLAALAVGVSISVLAGCSSSFAPSPNEFAKTSIGHLQGHMHGGQLPVAGSHIYVYAAGTSGYLGSATSLLKAGFDTAQDASGKYYVSTDANGAWDVTGEYTCVEGTQVYLVGVGGDSGPGGNNPAIVQLAALGQCPASGTLADLVPYVTINEISTVVMAYAVGGFGTTAYNVSSSATALSRTDLANAFANVGNIMSIANGFPYPRTATNPNSSVPMAKIISLANILGACVNSGSSTSTQCIMLFDDANNGGAAATDVTSAIFNIVHHPTENVTGLFGLIPTTPAFAGGLTTAPADFTVPIVYNGVVGKASNIAFDAAGNAWISDLAKKAVIEVSPQGAVHTYTNGGTFGVISNVAVAPPSAGTVWAADTTNNQLYVLNASGAVTETVTTGGLSHPSGIAFDQFGTAYVVNAGNLNISEFSSNLTAFPTRTYTPSLGTSVAIAVDFSGWAYTPTNTPGVPGIGELVSGQPQGYFFQDYASGFQINSATGVALDSYSNVPTISNFGNSNYVWLATTNGKLLKLHLADFGFLRNNFQAQSILNIQNLGGLSPTSLPATLSIDGATNLWIANAGSNIVSGFTRDGAALAQNGFHTGADLSSFANAAAVDGSGNVWTANSDGRVTQLLGLSVPVATPILPGQFAIMP
jgi:hypothetical protein